MGFGGEPAQGAVAAVPGRPDRLEGRPGPDAARPAPGPLAAVPDRYRVRRDGSVPTLRCSEAPSLEVRLERGRVWSAHEALRHAPGAIFLDGAAQAAPFAHPERALYNLDHHESCVRAATLATCEQAMVLVSRRLDLRRRDWLVYANDGDLDTVLAVWVLLNHLRLAPGAGGARARVMPLLRLEGCIDAHGVELLDLCALPEETLARAQHQMAALREQELALKTSGRWERIDLGLYMAARLRELDRMFLAPDEVAGLPEIEELARVELAPGALALVCRSAAGVYEVERELRRLYGERIALFALRKGSGTYTLRQVEGTSPLRLDALYAQLNLVDPSSGGSLADNRWGGSDEIGGSPRRGGTGLSPAQLVRSFRRAYAGSGGLARCTSLVAAAALASLAPLAAATPLPPAWAETLAAQGLPLPWHVILAPLATIALAAALLLLARPRAPGLFGLRRPARNEALVVAPLALLAAAGGGVWMADPRLAASGPPGTALAVAAVAALGVELLFRGCVHGVLARAWRIQRPGGPWFLSAPVLISALLYAAAHTTLSAPAPMLGPWLPTADPAWLVPLAALAFGLAAGVARERSESLLAPLALHWAVLVLI